MQGEQQDVMSCHVGADSHDLGPAISEEANLGSGCEGSWAVWWAVLGFILWHSPTDTCPGKMLGSSSDPHSGYYYLDFSDEEQGHLQSYGQKKAKPQAKVCPGLFRANYDTTSLCCSPHRTWFHLTLV